MEKYLIEEYGVIEDNKFLLTKDDIESYFKDIGRDYFDCGQGYYENEVNLICKIGDKFYNVTMYADISGAKQDRGDRLYWVEEVEKVTYKEIEKPEPKFKGEVSYRLKLINEQRTALEDFLKESSIEF